MILTRTAVATRVYTQKAMLRVARILMIVLMLARVKPSATSRANFIRQPLVGYRCELNAPSNQITLLATARAQCVWRCLSTDNCVVVSHNQQLKYCEVSMQLCDSVVEDVHFSINVYGMDRKLCSIWVPISGYDQQKAVVLPVKDGSTNNIEVARKEVNSGL